MDHPHFAPPPTPRAVDLEIDAGVGAGDWDRELVNWRALAEAALTAAFSAALEDRVAGGDGAGRQDAVPALGPALGPVHGEVSVVLSDDDGVRALNKQWRGKDRPTNVLSFPAMDEAVPLVGMPWLLGDIVLALETVMREAREQDKTPAAHFSHLLVHGMLHLLGLDHETPHQAARMEALEVVVLATLGIADPYPDRDEDLGHDEG